MATTLIYAHIKDLRAAMNYRSAIIAHGLAFFFTTSYVSANCSHTPLLSRDSK